ncbi:MAG: hypothetical protein CME38_16220 [Haliea sp.]|mgnify:CR=1 FL=1|nr:hypothetical protein [Haliea sp.]|tara:strand:+ start:1461 stop:1745 length:285 start_codon:yes stop_codon:yes gene_type:complete
MNQNEAASTHENTRPTPRNTSRQSKAGDQSLFIRLGPSARRLGVSLTKLNWLHDNDPTFPRKIRLSRRCVGFRRADLDAWLDMKAEEAAGEDIA